MFKAVVGRGHQEFGSSRQQDAQEFYLHLIMLIDRHQRNVPVSNPVDSFKFKVDKLTTMLHPPLSIICHSWRSVCSVAKVVK